MFKMICNILIDFDGTLHDTESVYASKLEGLLGLDGLRLYHIFLFDIHRKVVHEHYLHRHDDLNLHWRLLLQHLERPYDSETKNLLAIRFKEADKVVLENPKLFLEVPSFLDQVVKVGYRLCLSTGGGNSREKARAITKALFTNYFENVLGEEILGHLKHEPSYYEEALKKLSWKAENTVSIGDTILTDIYPAKVVGIKTIWVNRRNEKKPIEPEKTPDYETSNLISALNIIHALA
jgi:FMN phosphatase YigB (HAD superfamily)